MTEDQFSRCRLMTTALIHCQAIVEHALTADPFVRPMACQKPHFRDWEKNRITYLAFLHFDRVR